jgi:hypothetical protein
MAIETLEQWEQAQARMEDFARLAHNVKIAAEALNAAFHALADYPRTGILEAIPALSHLARFVANEAYEWASDSNADFDPASPAAAVDRRPKMRR